MKKDIPRRQFVATAPSTAATTSLAGGIRALADAANDRGAEAIRNERVRIAFNDRNSSAVQLDDVRPHP